MEHSAREICGQPPARPGPSARRSRTATRLFATAAVVLLWGAASGCDSSVDLDVPGSDPQLAAYSFFNPDSSWSVAVYRTVGLGEAVPTEALAVEGATVTVTTGSEVDTLEAASPGRYTYPSSSPVVGAEYAVEVAAPGFPPVRARDRVPARPDVSLQWERLEEEDASVPQANVRLSLTLRDVPGTNYYRIGVYRYVPPELQQEGIAWKPAFFSSTDPALRSSPATVGGLVLEGEQESFRVAYLNDELFDGDVRTFTLDTAFFLSGPNAALPPVRVVVTSMSTPYFEYHRRLELQRLNDDDPLADPVGLYTNVEGGVGVFGAYANTTRSF